MSSLRIIPLLVAALACTACDLTRTTRQVLPEVVPKIYTEVGPNGLKQTVWVTPPSAAIDDPSIVGIESQIENTSNATQRVIVRACALQVDDLFDTGQLVFTAHQPPDCTDRQTDTLDLAPGQRTPEVSGSFRVDPVGIVTVGVRHSITPQFGTEIRFRKGG